MICFQSFIEVFFNEFNFHESKQRCPKIRKQTNTVAQIRVPRVTCDKRHFILLATKYTLKIFQLLVQRSYTVYNLQNAGVFYLNSSDIETNNNKQNVLSEKKKKIIHSFLFFKHKPVKC